MLSKRGTGWRENKADPRDLPFGSMGLGQVSTVLNEPILLTPWIGDVFDQRRTNTCVTQGFEQQIEIVERQAFGTAKSWSRLAMYANSRVAHAPFAWAPIFDLGTYPRVCIKQVAKQGVPLERLWPFEGRLVNRRVPMGVRMAGHGARGAQYAFLMSGGDQRLDEIIQALRRGYPVGFGTAISTRYAESPLPIEDRPRSSDRIAGNHWQVIVGVRMNAYGQLEFLVLNSYSRFWGVNGFVWVTADYITWIKSKDFLVIYGWQRILNERPDFNL